MKALVFVITTFYWLKNFGFCSEENMTGEDFFTSVNLRDDKELYLETTQISIPDDVSKGLPKSYKKDFLKPIPVISDPLFEGDVWNKSSAKELNRKRYIQEAGFTHENKMMLLQLHNLYRSNVTPTAGNMAYMEWDEELARLAQEWSDGCIFDHGMPENDYPDTVGQNLYIGTDPTGYLGLWLWYEEHRFYDLRKDYCLPGNQCGHYVQYMYGDVSTSLVCSTIGATSTVKTLLLPLLVAVMIQKCGAAVTCVCYTMAWYLSDKLGCGMAKCGMRYLITCHYSPQALKGTLMYRVAKPCSQCPSKKGSLCLKNLCMTEEQCKNNPFDCKFAECNLECLNCGRLDKEKCLCECADGWDSPDCSYLCTNKHKRCGMSPGWPSKASCSMNNYAVAETYCRKMCNKCNAVNISISNDTCCGGTLCDEGFVLDPEENSCKCKLLCPGPLCDGDEDEEYQAVISRSNTIYLNSYFKIFMLVFALSHKILRKTL